VTLIDLQGKEIATTLPGRHHLPQAVYRTLIEKGTEDGFWITTLMIDGKPYQAVMVSIDAPLPIAWVMMGFAIDQALAYRLQQLTGLMVSFYAESSQYQPYLVSTYPQPQLLQQALPAISSKLDTLSRSTGPDTVQTLSLDDEKYLTLQIPLQLDYGQVLAYLQRPLGEAMQSFYTLRFNIILLTIFATTIAILVSISTARGVSRPLQSLAKATRRVAQGEYAEPLDMQSSDEFAELANAFNQMQQGIAEREQRILHHAHYDDLTGLPNRRLAEDRLQSILKSANSMSQPVTVLLVGLSQLKAINASLGHLVGDVVLQEVARRLVAQAGEVATIARLDGNEFLLILADIDTDRAIDISRTLIHELQQTIQLDAAKVLVNMHIGLAQFPEHGDSPQLLIQRAQIAMQDAKAESESLIIYTAGRDEGHLRHLSILSDLKRAVEQDEFQLYYQPKITSPSGEVREAEALIRWIHPQHGFMPPDEFIPVVEQSGSISLLTRWVFNQVVKQCKQWQQLGLQIDVGVNLSALDLRDVDLPVTLKQLLDKYNVPASQLVLEITESSVMRDETVARDILGRFRDMGMRIAIDDYGTGYSSLAQIKNLPVTELKIDKSFVMNLHQDNDDAVIVKSTIEMGHNMGLSVTAEGVETEAIRRILEQYGCDMLQGYYFSRPLPVDAFTEWLASFDGEPV
jgi:diguanylate cyclase (GGDEF)-like protein